MSTVHPVPSPPLFFFSYVHTLHNCQGLRLSVTPPAFLEALRMSRALCRTCCRGPVGLSPPRFTRSPPPPFFHATMSSPLSPSLLRLPCQPLRIGVPSLVFSGLIAHPSPRSAPFPSRDPNAVTFPPVLMTNTSSC